MKQQLQKLFLTLLLLVTSHLVMSQTTFVQNNLKYTVTSGTEVSVGKDTTCLTGALTIPSTVTFSGTDYTVTSIADYAFENCTSLTSVIIPDSVISIGKFAFRGCSILTTVDIPDSVNSIEPYSFSNCTSLTTVTIPEGVTILGTQTFASCTSLTTVTFPSSLNTLTQQTFYGCTALTEVNVLAITPPSSTSNVFQNITLGNVPLYVPSASISLYQSAIVWQDFSPIDTYYPTVSINQCSPTYTTPGGYIFTETGTYIETLDSESIRYNVTINNTPITQDIFTDETVCDDTAIPYVAEINTTNYLEFNKTDSRYVNLDVLQDDLAANDRSVFMWIKAPTNVVSTTQMLFAINSSGGGNICNLQIATNEKLEIYDGANSRTSTATLNDGLWHYVGYTYNNATNKTIAYVDGVSVLTYTNGQDATATSVYSLGQEYDSGLSTGNFYDGLIAETSVWNKVLDPTDITTAMANKITATHPSFANLVGYYSFAECGQNTAVLKDWSGNANDGTIIGSIINTTNFEEISNFNAEAWYTKSWQKNDVEFNTASNVNITPSIGTDTYKLVYTRDYISSTDTWDITNNAVDFTTQPTDVAVAPNANATFTSNGGSGVNYQWYLAEEEIINKTTADGIGHYSTRSVYESNGIIYVTTEGGLSISTDGGASFTNKTTANGLNSNNCFGVHVSNGIIYVATIGGLAISTDGGNTFINKTQADGLIGTSCYDVYKSNGIIYVATSSSGLSISTDNGDTFSNKTVVNNGLINDQTRGVYVSNGTIYVAALGGISISTDGGTSFTNKTTADGLASDSCSNVYESNGVIFVGHFSTSSGLSMSMDGGNTFTVITTANSELGGNQCNSIHESNGVLYVATNYGISMSSDGGNTFTNKTTSNGLLNNFCNAVYASEGNVYVAVNHGLSIIKPNTLLSGETNQDLTLNNVQLSDDGKQYFVAVSNASCTTASTTATLTVSETLGTEDNNLGNTISFFPNPVKHTLNISNSGLQNLKTIRIYNISGKLLYESAFKNSINMEKYSSGLYFIQVTTNSNETGTFKIIKE